MRICRIVQFAVAALLFAPRSLYGQELNSEIMSVELKSETEAVITYNLVGDPKAEYEVEVILLSEKDPDFELTLKIVSGDVGKGKFAGEGRTIKWNFGVDFPEVAVGQHYKFKLIVSKVTGGGIPWYVYAGGSVIVGGLAILLTSKPKEIVDGVKPIPLPPPR
jgi:hypothetical protein